MTKAKVNIVVKALTLCRVKLSMDFVGAVILTGGREVDGMTLNDISPFTVTSGTSESAKVPPADDWERRGQREHQGAYERPRDDFYGDNQPYGQGGLDSPSTSQYDTYGTAVYAPTSGEGRRFNGAQSSGYNNQAGAYSDGQSGFREESRGQYGNRTGGYDDSQNQYGELRYGRGGATEQHHQSSGMISKAKGSMKELKDRL